MKVEVADLGTPSLSPSPYGLCAPQASVCAVQSVWARYKLTLGRVGNSGQKRWLWFAEEPSTGRAQSRVLRDWKRE